MILYTAIPRFVRPSECTNSLCTSNWFVTKILALYEFLTLFEFRLNKNFLRSLNFSFLKITMKHPSSILLQIFWKGSINLRLNYRNLQTIFWVMKNYEIVFAAWKSTTAIPRFVRPSECTNSLCTSYCFVTKILALYEFLTLFEFRLSKNFLQSLNFSFLRIIMKHPRLILLQIF